ncbi:hypothetical protein [Finegoldia magna]|nr:hypothetical protein [Finegoldia magna]
MGRKRKRITEEQNEEVIETKSDQTKIKMINRRLQKRYHAGVRCT